MERSKLKHYIIYDDELKEEETLPTIPQPETPNESMEFLARSWSLSADELSKAIETNNNLTPIHQNLNPFEPIFTNHEIRMSSKAMEQGIKRRGAIGKLFHHKVCEKKDKARVENARAHALVSVAGLAAALAAATATKSSDGASSKTSMVLTSATRLLAQYCIELAESGGADKECVASTVRSALAVRSATHLLTLTAAAATALRGEAAVRARLPKRSATVSPYEKATPDYHSPEDLPCVGDLLQLTRKGVLRWKHICVYINKAHKVTMKMKSKHVGGAFSKYNKCVVYGVIEESGEWPFRKERVNMELYIGVKTGQGLLEFKCRTAVDKQRWVHGIRKLVHRTTQFKEAENSLRMLNINSI